MELFHKNRQKRNNKKDRVDFRRDRFTEKFTLKKTNLCKNFK
jgi:hypothetical protein